MEKLKSSLINMVGVLTGVALVTAGLLAYVNHVTEGPKTVKAENTLAAGIKAVMCTDQLTVSETDTIAQADAKGKELKYIVYKTVDAQNKFLGAAVQATTLGFGGDLSVLVGFDGEGQILGYTVLKHAETPGLGAKATDWFQKGQKGDIIGKSPKEKELKVTKDGGDIDAITASTITSRAFLNAINQAYAVYAKGEADGESGATKQQKEGEE